MTEGEFGVLAKAMSAIYASDKFMATPESVALWYRLLSDIPYDVGRLAVESYMATEKFPPKPSDIRERAVLFVAGEKEKDDMEVWAEVYDGICRSTYHSQEVFDGFPKDVQRAVGSADNLRAWASTDIDSVNSVIQSQFLKAYRGIKEEKKKELVVPKNVMLEIDKAKEKLGIGSVGIEKKIDELEDCLVSR